MLVDEFPDWGVRGPKSLGESPVTIHLYVEDVDAFTERAVGAGAKITMPIADMLWGDRLLRQATTDPPRSKSLQARRCRQ